MASVRRIFQLARGLGDASSLTGGQNFTSWQQSVISAKARVGRRIGGRAISGIFRMNMWGLILWGEFFNEFRNQIQLYNSRDVWLGTAVKYAPGYEFGFSDPSGERRRRQFFFPAVKQAVLERKFGSRINFGITTASRSGLYAGGRYVADIRAIKGGVGTVGRRGIRRSTGAQASRLFWGTLRNPKFNVLHAIAERAKVLARQNIKSQGLFSKGLLHDSIAIGNTFEEMMFNSRQQALKGQGGTLKRPKAKFFI